MGLNAVGHETRTHSRTVNKYINNKYLCAFYKKKLWVSIFYLTKMFFFFYVVFFFFITKEEGSVLECYTYMVPFPDQLESYEAIVYEVDGNHMLVRPH